MKAICVGHSTFDITLPMMEYPKENLKYRLKGHIDCGGGPASNGAYLLAKWGIDTTIVSVVGNDYYGERIIKEFEDIGVDTRYIEKVNNHRTTSSYIVTNMSNGSRTILSSKDEPIRKLSKKIDIRADIILVDGEHPETAKEVLNSNPDAISVLDAGRLNDDTKELGKMVTYLVCSKTFAEEFTNKKIHVSKIDELTEIYKELEKYFHNTVVITLEANGSFSKIGDKYQIIPTVKVKALDSTGAGDIFHGAFIYFIGHGYSLLETIHLSSITSAISVGRIGSRNSIPNLKEVLEYEQFSN